MSEAIPQTVDVRSLSPAVDKLSRDGVGRPEFQDVLFATRQVLTCLGVDYPNGATPAEFAGVVLRTAADRSAHSSEVSAAMRLCSGVLHGLLEPDSEFGDAAWQAILDQTKNRPDNA